jgi:hypothetical protein
MNVRIAQQTLKFESKGSEEVRTAQQMQATESTRLHEGLDTNAMTADSESTLCNCLDVRVAGPDVLQ